MRSGSRPGRGRPSATDRPARLPSPGMTTVAPHRVDQPEIDEVPDVDHGWNVVVWNDPVNLMSYVVYVFRKLFGHPLEEATRRDW